MPSFAQVIISTRTVTLRGGMQYSLPHARGSADKVICCMLEVLKTAETASSSRNSGVSIGEHAAEQTAHDESGEESRGDALVWGFAPPGSLVAVPFGRSPIHAASPRWSILMLHHMLQHLGVCTRRPSAASKHTTAWCTPVLGDRKRAPLFLLFGYDRSAPRFLVITAVGLGGRFVE